MTKTAAGMSLLSLNGGGQANGHEDEGKTEEEEEEEKSVHEAVALCMFDLNLLVAVAYPPDHIRGFVQVGLDSLGAHSLQPLWFLPILGQVV